VLVPEQLLHFSHALDDAARAELAAALT